MNQDETIALFRQGKDAWNAWAESILAERKAMEADERWAAEHDCKGDFKSQTATRDWMQQATADFSALRLITRALADEEKAKGGAKEERSALDTPPVASIVVEAQNIDFEGRIFPGKAEFRRAQFHGYAVFGNAQFHGWADFDNAQFHGRAWFGGSQFHDKAGFEKAQFHDRAGFTSAQFHGQAGFSETDFKRNLEFSRARFGKMADFSLITFPMVATFAGAHFEGPANFNAIRGERAFDLAKARFERVPDFIQAHFGEAPRLDNVEVIGRMVEPYAPAGEEEKAPPLEGIPRPKRLVLACKRVGRKGWRNCQPAWTYPRRWGSGAWRRCSRGAAKGSELRDIAARWRALKRLAVQAHDQDREHEFFAREIRAARFVTDWPLPWPFWKGQGWAAFARFWFGFLYGLFGGHGRSVALPVIWWTLIVSIATAFYLGEHAGVMSDRASLRKQGHGWSSAWIASTYKAAWETPESCHAPANQPPGRPSAYRPAECQRA